MPIAKIMAASGGDIKYVLRAADFSLQRRRTDPTTVPKERIYDLRIGSSVTFTTKSH